MNTNYDFKKIEADKIALLALFVLALLIAYILVSVKSTIILSEPIELAHSGISISVPVGNGWQSNIQWEYQSNSFTLSSDFSLNSDRQTARAFCRYLLAAETISPQRWFEQKAAEIQGTIINTNQDRINTLTINWAHIQKPELALNTFIGTIELPYNRQLNIEVHQIVNDVELAEKIFQQIVNSLSFEDNQLFKAGSEIIETIKSKGLDSYIDNQNQQAYFLIKDSGERAIGFMIDALIDSDLDAPFNIQGASHFYGRKIREQATLFRCRNNLEEFIWESETNSVTGRNRTEIILEEAGIMTVKESKAQTELRYRLSPAAIPDIFLEQLLNQIIQSNTKEIIVDIIDADGKIIPTRVSVIEEKENFAASEEAIYLIKMEFLDGQSFSELLFLNDKQQITKAIVQQNNRYIFESTTREDIVEEFPERADFIMQKSNMLRENI